MQTWHPLAMIWPPLQKLLYRIRPKDVENRPYLLALQYPLCEPEKYWCAVSRPGIFGIITQSSIYLQGDFETEDIYIDGTIL